MQHVFYVNGKKIALVDSDFIFNPDGGHKVSETSVEGKVEFPFNILKGILSSPKNIRRLNKVPHVDVFLNAQLKAAIGRTDVETATALLDAGAKLNGVYHVSMVSWSADKLKTVSDGVSPGEMATGIWPALRAYRPTAQSQGLLSRVTGIVTLRA